MAGSVSLVVPNFNYGRYIREAIESVVHQDDAPEELLIIDDGSTDDSRAVIEDCLSRMTEADRKRVTLVFNESNLGIVDNFRKAVAITKGDYIAFVGADNRADAAFVRELRRALDDHPEAAVAYFDMLIFGPRAPWLAARVDARPVEGSEGVFHWTFTDPTPEAIAGMAVENFINGSSMYRRAAYDAVGGYRKTSRPEDADLFTRMLAAGYGAVRVPKPLLEYRQHSAVQANTVLVLEQTIEDLRERLRQSEEWAAHLQRENEELRQRIHMRLWQWLKRRGPGGPARG